MKATVSMELLWKTLQSLSLENKEWLSSKLIEDIREEKEEIEYISKEEILAGIRQGLLDVKEDRKNGTPLKTLQEVIDELWDYPPKTFLARNQASEQEVPLHEARFTSFTGWIMQ